MNPDVKSLALRDAFRRGERILSVHYACENLYTAEDHPPAVACVSVTQLGDAGFSSFSPAEYDLEGELSRSGSDAEKALLNHFFAFMRENQDANIVHWKMSSSDYGFEAIERRYEFIGQGKPYCVSRDRTFDLDDLIAHRYGKEYADHPRFYSLAVLNGLSLRHALKGAEEADAAARGDHAGVKRSTASKVRTIAALAERYLTGLLVTKNSAGAVEFAGSTVDAVELILVVSQRVLYVSRELKRRYNNRTTLVLDDEYDFQDLFRALLRLFFDDIRPEEWAPSYAGGASRVDFVLPEFELAIELKFTRDRLTDRELGEQLIVDARKYAEHPNVRHLLCVILDHDGNIRNPRGLESDLSSQTYEDGGISVSVSIVDR